MLSLTYINTERKTAKINKIKYKKKFPNKAENFYQIKATKLFKIFKFNLII